MRKYTFEQYVEMSERFNNMSFANKIKTLVNNSDLFGLANDYNWWWVEILDEEIKDVLEENNITFVVPNEWGESEMIVLLQELKVNLVGC